MIYLLWVLRVVHVLAGVFWGGAALAMTLYFSPAIVATQQLEVRSWITWSPVVDLLWLRQLLVS